MEELEVTRLWMAGVVGMMLAFAAIALAGYVYRRRVNKIQAEESNG